MEFGKNMVITTPDDLEMALFVFNWPALIARFLERDPSSFTDIEVFYLVSVVGRNPVVPVEEKVLTKVQLPLWEKVRKVYLKKDLPIDLLIEVYQGCRSEKIREEFLKDVLDDVGKENVVTMLHQLSQAPTTRQ